MVDKITELAGLLTKLHATTDDTVFFDFSGHVDLLTVQVHEGGYYNTTETIGDTTVTKKSEPKSFVVWLYHDDTEENINNIIDYVKERLANASN